MPGRDLVLWLAYSGFEPWGESAAAERFAAGLAGVAHLLGHQVDARRLMPACFGGGRATQTDREMIAILTTIAGVAGGRK